MTTFTSLFLFPTEVPSAGNPDDFSSSGQMNCPCGKVRASGPDLGRANGADVVKNKLLTLWAS